MEDQASSTSETIKNTSIFSFFTIFSRLFGLLRDMLKAYVFGTSILSVAFDIAFRLPNVMRNLVAEGALSQSFIPLYSDYSNNKQKEREASGSVLLILFLLLTTLSIAAWYFLPILIPWLMNDVSLTRDVTQITINLSQILFPFILFISLTSVYTGIQYSHNIFWSGSIGPALMNLFILFVFGSYFLYHILKSNKLVESDAIYFWSYVVLLSGVFQLAFQVWRVKKLGLSPIFSLSWKHPIIKGLFFMMLPASFAAGVQELGQLIDIFLATSLMKEVPGAVSALAYSHRLIQLPMGVLGVAVATASLPLLSRLYNEGKKKDFQRSLIESIRLNLFLLVPATIGLVLLAKPIISLIFERGEFTSASTTITAYSLVFYAIGIPAFSLQKLFIISYYAQKNSRFPTIVTILTLVLNVSLSLILMPYLQHGGLALGSSLAAFISVLIYLIALSRGKYLVFSNKDINSMGKIIFANLLIALILYGLSFLNSEWSDMLRISFDIVVVILSYLMLSHLLMIPEYFEFVKLIRKRLSK